MSTPVDEASRNVHKAVFVLACALLTTVVVTALISPTIVDALHLIGVADARLDKVAIRTLELVAIAVTVVALIYFGGGGRGAWGVPRRPALVRRLSIGFGCGLLSLGAACALLYVFEVRVLRHDLSVDGGYWLRVLLSAILSAAAVGVLEEIWFRGGLFTLLRRCGGIALALLGGSLLYAAAHFLAVPGEVDAGELQHWTGLQVLAAAAQNMFQLQHMDSMLALFIAGVTLALLRWRQGDVAVCIGIHAGWVVTIRVFKKLTDLSPTGTNRFLAGHYDDVIGWVAAACLAVMLILVWRFVRPGRPA